MKNMVRLTSNFVKIIEEICQEENIELESFSSNWIFRLYKDGKYNYIIRHQFGLNTASVHTICCDKSAASEIMSSFNIPNVEHFFFMSPINQKSINDMGNWELLKNKLNEYGQLVCKSNEGFGGKNVFRVSNQYELENAVHKIFGESGSMAVSPYYEVCNEFRVIVLDGTIKIIFSKQRPYIVGDGIHSMGSLIFTQLQDECINNTIATIEDDLTTVLDKGEIFYLNWKHNLGQGAIAEVIEDNIIKNKLESIVNVIAEKLNIRFASIDIVEVNNEYKVLEINSGVMMEHFSQRNENYYNITKSIYKEAILKMLV